MKNLLHLHLTKEDSEKLNLKASTINYKGKKIQTYSFGKGDNVVLSLPAYPHSGLLYFFFLEAYPHLENTRFITFDLPGWLGLSENVFEDNIFNYETILDIAKTVLEKHNVKQYSLLGFSFGTSIAVNLAVRDLANVKKLILVSPFLNGSLVNERAFKVLDTIKRFRLDFIMKYYLLRRYRLYEKVFTQTLNTSYSDILTNYEILIKNANTKVIIDSLYTLYHSDFSEQVKLLASKKILVINSKDESKYLRLQSEHLRRILNIEDSYFIHGDHQDFILKPNTETVKKIMEYLSEGSGIQK